jgi:glycosyltransferase involved in cell wall biosynthesis
MNETVDVLFVTNVFNQETRDALLSCKAEESRLRLIYVWDGNPSEFSREELTSFTSTQCNFFDVEYLVNNKCGLTVGLNLALANVTSEYVARLDADDISHPQRFDLCKNIIETHDHITWVFSNCVKFNSNEIPSNKNKYKLETLTHKPLKFRLRNKVAHGSLFARASFFSKFRYDETFTYAQDFELWTRIQKVKPAHLVEADLYFLRLSSNSVSSQKYVSQTLFASKVAQRSFFKNSSSENDFRAVQIKIFEIVYLICFSSKNPWVNKKGWRETILKFLYECVKWLRNCRK